MKTDKFLLDEAQETILLDVVVQPKNDALWQSYQAKKENAPMLFPLEGAKALGVSELELLLASPYSTYLGNDCRAMLDELHILGEVENIVRNDFAVHEKQAQFINLKIGDVMGLSMGEGAFDLRFFMKRWQHILAIANTDGKRPSYCIAFFDGLGQAIDKVFLKDIDDEKVATWQKLVDKYTDNQTQSIQLQKIPHQNAWQLHTLSDEQKADFHRDWLAMTDIHQFHKILSNYELDRASSYHQSPEGYAKQVSPKIIEALFHQLSEQQIAMMTFVGNTGIVQIDASTPKHIKRLGDWINILDKGDNKFTLHLNDNAISQAWWIKRPNDVDFTTAFECFDDKGNSIVTFFGVRTEGTKQDEKWQTLAEQLANEFAV